MRTVAGTIASLLMIALPASTAGQSTSGRVSTVASCQNERTLLAVAQTLGVNVVINRANAWVRPDGDFADVDFQSWMDNVRFGWQWDETQFTTNMFAHPYHGSLYFAAGRANCLDFWESIPITFLGSWTWEFLGERWRPSLNDFWMTGFGGMALGEMLHRVSAAIIDERADGSERLVREFGAMLVNPVGGLNRLVRGQWGRRGPNPPDRHPEAYLFRASVGGRSIGEANTGVGATATPTFLIDVSLGDLFETRYGAPFDVTNLFVQVSPDGRGLNVLRASGRLWGREFTPPDGRHRHQLALHQRIDYVNSPAYHYGEQSAELGFHSRWRTGPGDLRLSTRVAGEVVMLGAIDALAAGVGRRTIDFGPGLGAYFEVSLESRGTTYLSFYNRVRYLRSVSGAPADHSILFSGIDLTVPITERVGIGAHMSGDRRQSLYSDFPDDVRTYRETRVYLTYILDQRVPGRSR